MAFCDVVKFGFNLSASVTVLSFEEKLWKHNLTSPINMTKFVLFYRKYILKMQQKCLHQ